LIGANQSFSEGDGYPSVAGKSERAAGPQTKRRCRTQPMNRFPWSLEWSGKQGIRLNVQGCRRIGGELDSTGQLEALAACRGWSAGHVKSRPPIKCRASARNGCLAKVAPAEDLCRRGLTAGCKFGSPRVIVGYARGQNLFPTGRCQAVSVGPGSDENQSTEYTRRCRRGNVAGRGFDPRRLHCLGRPQLVRDRGRPRLSFCAAAHTRPKRKQTDAPIRSSILCPGRRPCAGRQRRRPHQSA